MNILGIECSTKDLNVNYINTRALQMKSTLENRVKDTWQMAWAKMILTSSLIIAYQPHCSLLHLPMQSPCSLLKSNTQNNLKIRHLK